MVAKERNGFYVRQKRRSSLKIGMQNLEADRAYVYRYDEASGRHVGRWVSTAEETGDGENGRT